MNRLVLLSGGLDSAVCLAMNRGAHTLFVNYNQEARRPEMLAARRIARAFNAKHHEAAIYQHGVEIDRAYADAKGVVPMRNCLLISMAALVGKTVFGDADMEVIIGVQQGDQHDFVDCRPLFIDQMNQIGSAFGVSVSAPLLTKNRAEVEAMACSYDNGADFMKYIWSCYRSDEHGPCGECLSCSQ